MSAETTPTLEKGLGPLHLWGIAVGLVISGEYFGWSYGWALAGTLGFLVTTVLIAVMYTTFIFSFTELTTSIPHAGGPFAYSYRAFGPFGGFIAGFATLIEFIFAPPAIALAIGSYLNVQFPSLEPRLTAVGAYVVFMALNIVGVTIAATFELLVTILAVVEDRDQQLKCCGDRYTDNVQCHEYNIGAHCRQARLQRRKLHVQVGADRQRDGRRGEDEFNQRGKARYEAPERTERA